MIFSKRVLFLIALLTFGMASTSMAQDKSKRPSPPAEAKATIGDLTISISYGSPAVKGRKIWGSLEAYDKVWRTGANEATTIEVNKDVVINGETLPAGKYALFSIPKEKEDWVVIFNKDAKQWGAYNYSEAKDALRIKVKAEKTEQLTERLTFKVDETGIVTFAWEYLTFSFTVKKA